MKTRSVYLDPTTWDRILNASGEVTTVTHPYAVAQDVACAVKTIKGEVIFDTSIGIPYFSDLLGKGVSTGTLSSWLKKQAERLSIVQSASVTLIPNKSTRNTSGYIEIVDTNGTATQLVL